ncbi:MAG: rhomboid family intramembrane serine protease [Myxococcota bacterium]
MEAPDFRIPLRELPPIIGGKTRWFVALTLGPLFSFIAFALLTDRIGGWPAFGLVFCTDVALLILWRQVAQARGRQHHLVRTAGALHIPTDVGEVVIPEAELTEVRWTKLGLLFLSPDRSALLPRGMVSTEVAGQIEEALGRKLGTPNVSRERLPRFWKAPFSAAVIATSLGLFAFAVWSTPAGSDVAGTILNLGAMSNAHIAAGQGFRVLTAGLLHFSWTHVLGNMSALVTYRRLEVWLGWRRMAAIFLVGVITGDLLAMASPTATLMAGSSTGLYGMFGALFVIAFRYRRDPSKHYYFSRKQIVIALGLNLIFSLMPGISALGHLGGLLGGAATSFFVLPKLDEKIRDVRRGETLGVALSALAAVCMAYALFRFVSGAAVPADIRAAGPKVPEVLNLLAQDVARRPTWDPALAEVAISALAKIEPKARSANDLSTEAELLRQLGRTGEAAVHSREALAMSFDASVASTFLRIPPTTTASISVVERTVGRGANLRLGPSPSGQVVFLRTGQRFLRVVAEASAEPTVLAPRELAQAAPDKVEILQVFGGPPLENEATAALSIPANDPTPAPPR